MAVLDTCVFRSYSGSNFSHLNTPSINACHYSNFCNHNSNSFCNHSVTPVKYFCNFHDDSIFFDNFCNSSPITVCNSRSLSILYYNARSLPRLSELQLIAEAYAPSVICVTETWLSSDFKIKNYLSQAIS